MRRLSLRARLGLLAAAAVAVAVTGVAVTAWLLTERQLNSQLDSNLRSVQASPAYIQGLLRMCQVQELPTEQNKGDRTPTPYTVQVVTGDGTVCTAPGSSAIKVGAGDLAVALGLRENSLHDAVSEEGQAMRVATSRPDSLPQMSGNYAVSIAQPLSVISKPLNSLAWLLLGVAGVGVVGAATAGVGIARAGLRPMKQLMDVTEHIARTEDLSVRIRVDGDDEIARLAESFNAMTAALASSRERQQQLVADAGHELRTPLTSLRTNIELMMRSEKTGRELPPDVRRDLLSSVEAQITELAGLIGDIQELSRPDAAPGSASMRLVALHEGAERALARARLRGKELTFTCELEDWFVWGEPAALERAIVNLLDNAVKFSPAGGTVSLRLQGGRLSIKDEGPGVPPDELPYVFERFWRSPSARSLPGSGLGLAIVARAVQASGGTVGLHQAPGGGALAVMTVPGARTPPPETPPRKG
ncbi:two-component system sensor histidine kinase MprB [Streptomyces nodosus]|uniref:sensor histidine kinase n=1 Tax=Streptomyces nodosus TaxID=40318 RepID=UPI0017F56F4C|nr:HAMP domain-containing sensor histidine kinase [Streptomyces nodosus]MBB4793446.1 two-component system sensor histidine kinase MprB [Streptomyces nodosus]